MVPGVAGSNPVSHPFFVTFFVIKSLVGVRQVGEESRGGIALSGVIWSRHCEAAEYGRGNLRYRTREIASASTWLSVKDLLLRS